MKTQAPAPEQKKLMKNSRSKSAAFLTTANFVLPAAALLLLACLASVRASNDNRAPAVPASLQVPDGNKVEFHAYAAGVQIYTATTSPTDSTKLVWTFTAPEAVLFDADGNNVGIHYAFAGPTRPAWESESGSRVVGARTVPPVSVNSNAIPWLILSAVATNTIGPGIFDRTTYIQRVNTSGGLAPATLPATLGQVARVPYTAEYFFYRATK